MQQTTPNRWSLAPLAFLAGLVPFVAAHLVLFVSISRGYVEPCNPYLDGCMSISRAARYGLSNHLFQAIMLPYATLLAMYWLACRRWLLESGDTPGPALRWMPWLGIVSASFLVLYATYLGSEGDFYRLMRRYGVTVYFSFNYLAQILLTKRMFALREAGLLMVPGWIPGTKLALCVIVLALGLANVAGSVLLEDNYTFENVIEWHAALAMTLFYFFTWAAWRRTDYRL